MRITRKQFDRAKKIVDEAKEKLRIVKIWQDATKGYENVSSVRVNQDGTVEVLIKSPLANVEGS